MVSLPLLYFTEELNNEERYEVYGILKESHLLLSKDFESFRVHHPQFAVFKNELELYYPAGHCSTITLARSSAFSLDKFNLA